MFNVLIEKRALKDLEHLPQRTQTILLRKIHSTLSANPFPCGKNPKRLSGMRAFRLRIGNYRVLYEIVADKVLVFAIGDRKEVYRKM